MMLDCAPRNQPAPAEAQARDLAAGHQLVDEIVGHAKDLGHVANRQNQVLPVSRSRHGPTFRRMPVSDCGPGGRLLTRISCRGDD